ncbi:hypothetical protein TCE0_022f06439 [Talaromyces pinophilus]|uniref:Uncharacterized protein n=1 Tax=Talaromyces pinophilus TaxID=128442 RepID=A0A6V8HEZ9_TALPI|nr:hypothetical protein TCE0_022f06439 [Talaromyces pinophilus]
MSETRCAPNLTAAFSRLLEIARSLLSRRLTYSRELQQAKVLAHISGLLALAIEAPNSLQSAFLVELVALCKWRSQTSSYRELIQRHPTSSSDLTVDPKIWLCQEAEKHANEGFLAYASCSAKEQETLQYFRTKKPYELVAIDNTNIPVYELDSVTEGDTLEDYPDFVTKDLYTALSEYSRCSCPQSKVSKKETPQHEARLHLTGRSSLSSGFAVFDFHFHSSPTLLPDEPFGHWQQLRLRVSSTRMALKKARFSEQETPSPNSVSSNNSPEVDSPTDQYEPMSKEDFCDLLRKDDGPVKICLQVKDRRLFDLRDPEVTDQSLARKQSIPLAQVLTSYDLSSKMKLVLGYTLARSMWQYYDSDWARASWSTQSIQFMREMHRMERLSVTCRPCFTVRFRDEDNVVPEYCDLRNICHKYPRILSLGTLLINIGWGDHNQAMQQDIYSPAQKINNECTLGQQVRSNPKWPRIGHGDKAAEELRTLYKDATMACFDSKLFKPICDRCSRKKTECVGQTNESCKGCVSAKQMCTYKAVPRLSKEALALGVQSRRKILLEKVVLPLRKALHLVNWEDSLDKPEAIPLKPDGNKRRPLGQRRYPCSGDPDHPGDSRLSLQKRIYRDSAQFFDDERLPDSELGVKCQQYVNWKEMFVKTAGSFEETELADSDRLKIAVLDTGLDKSHPDIEIELDRIWVYNNSKKMFEKSENGTIADSKGHGTHIVGLVLVYAADADLYVADVTVNGEADRGLIASAIRCAVDRKVDIISISFGFQQKIFGDALEKAIDYAKENKVHIFAAASNNGGNTGRSWPARYDGVFCIHSTDASGNPSGFNPTELEEINFATVGEAVESSWPGHLSQSPESLEIDCEDGDDTQGGAETPRVPPTEVKSGTSFATPIAASIAAFLLRYAKTHLDPEHVQQLKRHSVMRSVLKCMAGPKRKEFYYLTLRSNPDHLFGKEDPEDIRRDIITAIKQSG